MTRLVTVPDGAGFMMTARPSRATIGRLIRYAIATGSLTPDTSPVGKAAWILGFVRGRARRLAGPTQVIVGGVVIATTRRVDLVR